MNFPDYFADADSDFDDADFIIFGVPYDKTSSFRTGAQKAPGEIRCASWNFETFDLRTGIDLKDIKVHDYGDLEVTNLSPKEMVEKVRAFTSKVLAKNKVPIAIGGEHSITLGIVQAFSDDIAVLALDAHFDFREQYDNDIYNHACVIKRIASCVDVRDIAVLGMRSAEKEEYSSVQQRGLFFIDVFTIRKKGFSEIIRETKRYLGDKKIYLTLDMDVVDLAYAPGTSTPEPFGLTPFDILECIEAFSSQIIGFDVVEVCPSYDHGETSLLAAKFIRSVIGNVWNQA